jgi:hypothetical protein
VNGTAASVTAALANISNGTLNGLVPGVALINTVASTNAAIDAYTKAVASSNPTFDANKDGVVTSTEANAAASTANTARFDAGTGVSTKTTATLTTEASTAAAAAVSAKAVVTATTGGPAALAAYDAAVAAQKALVGTTAATATKTALQVATENASTAATAALAGVDAAATAGTLTTYAKLNTAFGAPTGAAAITDIASLKAALNSPASAVKTALQTELAKVTTFGQQAIDSVAKEASFVKAAADVTTAHNAAVLTTSNYITLADASDTAAALLVKAQAADVAVAAAKVVTDQFAKLTNDQTVAKAALDTFTAANTDKVVITDVAATAAGTAIQATAKADVFYFASKALAANDFAIGGTTNFGAGDSIVLGSAYTYNAGALSTGNSNALEFFLVKGAAGTQVVIENDAYGNSTTTVDAAGNVTASPNATVINLVGVTADHLSVANGVVSYV